jgi:hypothetical protein
VPGLSFREYKRERRKFMANSKTSAVAKVPEETEVSPFDSPLAVIADAGIIAIAEQAEKRIEAFEKIKMYALRTTNAHDWVNEGGKPYLQDSGANKVARVFGVSWRLMPPEIEYLEGAGGHFIVNVKGDFAIGGAVIQAVGSRSSNDPFFTDRYEGQGEARHKVKRPASEIDRGDVIKAAVSNCTNNGVKKLLGLMNLTWEDLEEYASIKPGDVGSVDFKKGGKPTSSQGRAPSSSQGKKETKQPGNGDEPATMDQAQAIHNIFKSKGIGDELAKMQEVAKILGLKEVPTSLAKLTKSQASTVIAALQKETEGGE